MATEMTTSGPESPPNIFENVSSDEQRRPLPSFFTICFNILNDITHLFIGATACCAYLVALIRRPEVSDSYFQHILLCSTGYIILMSLAVLTLSPHTGWTFGFKPRDKRAIHLVMQISGSTLAIAGSAIRIVDIEEHLTSTHGILGLVTLIPLFISLIGGAINLCTPNMKITSGMQKFIKICHSCLGSITLVLAFVSLIFGFLTLYDTVLDDVVLYAVIVSGIALLGTILSAFITSLRRICC